MEQKNRYICTRFAKGLGDRTQMDDSTYSLKACVSVPAMDFNDDRIRNILPDNAIDIDGCELLDANNPSRVKIHRDWI